MEPCDVNDVKINHDFLQLDAGAVPQSAEKLRVVTAFKFSAYIRIFIKGLIETNGNISNELNFSDVY